MTHSIAITLYLVLASSGSNPANGQAGRSARPAQDRAPDEAPNDDTPTAQARRHYAEGVQHFKLARFEQALAAFEDAYEAKPHPALLFNLAQCHFQLHNYAKAAFFYEGYLSGQPRAGNRVAVEQRIAEAKRLANQQPVVTPQPAAATSTMPTMPTMPTTPSTTTTTSTTSTTPEPSASGESGSKPDEMALSPTNLVPTSESAEEATSGWWWWGGAGVAVGGVVMVGLVAGAATGITVLVTQQAQLTNPTGTLGRLGDKPTP